MSRTLTDSFCLLESQTRRYVDIEHADFLHPLGLRHFYDGFSLRAEVSIRSSALVAFQFQEEEVSPDLVLSRAAVAARGGLVPRPPLQKPPSRGLEGSGRGLQLQGGLKGASRGLEGGFKGASRGLHLEGGFKGA